MADSPLDLWSNRRLSPGKADDADDHSGHRTRYEQDYDRILFSTSVRRLSDKTQVFPLDTNDGVRTRLTHSHEVANLARSMGLRIESQSAGIFDGQDVHRAVLPLLGAGGLAHDLGNPPFGHQGEAAIAGWFETRKGWIFDRRSGESDESVSPIQDEYRGEFLGFDGNPQSLRILSRLHTSQGQVGLDLTAATIMTTIKYPVSAKNVDKSHPATKKYGYFCSENHVVDWARGLTGLKEGQRHPLSWIIEASDDSAYSVLDVEDAMKKGIISPEDLLNILKCDTHLCTDAVFAAIKAAFEKADSLDREPIIVRDIKIGYARSILIDALVKHATDEFVKNKEDIWKFKLSKSLMDTSLLCERLKDVAREYAFGNTEVLHIEARGRKAIEDLLDQLWSAIMLRKDPERITSKRSDANARFIYSLFSPNYLEAAEAAPVSGSHATATRLRYRELRLLTDMVSGMTDSYSMRLAKKMRTLA